MFNKLRFFASGQLQEMNFCLRDVHVATSRYVCHEVSQPRHDSAAVVEIVFQSKGTMYCCAVFLPFLVIFSLQMRRLLQGGAYMNRFK